MNPQIQITTEREFIAMALVAGSELANRWMQSMQTDAQTNLQNMLANGTGLELVLTLHPVPSVDMRLIDSDGSRVRLAAQVIHTKTTQ
jgi:hypothetical protein